MAASASTPDIAEPFPIFKLAHRYLLYDANTVSYIRQKYDICGVFIGSLPQAPQQNVFLGLPLELMSEEAWLLVEKGVAYVVDDVRSHKSAFLGHELSVEERKAYQAALRKQGVGAAREATRRTDDRKKAALIRKLGTENWNDVPEDMLKPPAERRKDAKAEDGDENPEAAAGDEDESLFASPMNSFPSGPGTSRRSSVASSAGPEPYAITPTTSYPPLKSSAPPIDHWNGLGERPQSYPLFKHLHEQGYFLAPGLRFGCRYTAYPGDPLRFHSHFLCSGMDWDQEFDLLDLVGGGRLGTGVKKGFLIGGREEVDEELRKDRQDEPGGGVRTFCIEWGGM